MVRVLWLGRMRLLAVIAMQKEAMFEGMNSASC